MAGGFLPAALVGKDARVNDQLPGKEPLLIPTPSLTPDEFEDFTERLLHAHRFCTDPVRRVVRVERWGRKGDSQDGIDFEGTWSDGKTAAWQCKRYDDLPVAKVKKFIKECTFEADEYYLVYSGEASRDARDEVANHDKWQLLDRRGLGRLVDDLPLHKRRQVLDATWGVQKRNLLLEVPGEDAFLSLATFASDRQDPGMLLNDCAPLIGRDAESLVLKKALDRSADWAPIILVTGPGGRGKSRLTLEALGVAEIEQPQIPVICLADGRSLDAEALRELPQVPATIFVDDAHRDPAAIAPLLGYLRRAPGTQLVLTSRGTGRDQVRAEIVRKGFRLDQIQEVSVGELSMGQARKLVETLSVGMEFSAALSEHLAAQAVDSPHIAVLATNMMRRGELAGNLALDPGLREQVLLRYQEILSGPVDDFDGDTVRRVLAVFAAIGPVASDDKALASKVADFCHMKVPSYLRLRERLHNRGLLATRSGLTRITPDILADQILERESAIQGQDTGFTAEVWDAFRDTCRARLVVALSELDWRLSSHGGPSIIDNVWAGLWEDLGRLSLASLLSAIKELEPLGYTQPKALLELLEHLRTTITNPPVASPASPEEESTTVDDEADLRAALNLAPITAQDVIELMPPFYGLCAVNAPGLLETALDALWMIRCGDARQPHQYPDHPERVVEDTLGNLGDLPDPSFPDRIAARVEHWLTERTDDQAFVTPLFALKPLLLKEGQRFIAKNRREVAIRHFLVYPSGVRPVRDSIRQILLKAASGPDLPCAGQAVELLGTALEQPRGLGSAAETAVPGESWDADDLATVAALAAVAESTSSSVIRRQIRHQVEWSAQYSNSLQIRYAALTLIKVLDDKPDDLAECLLDHYGQMTSLRGQKESTLADIQAALELEKTARVSSSNSDAYDDYSLLMEGAEALIERRDAERAERLNSVTRSLMTDDLGAALDVIEDCCSQVQLVKRDLEAARGLGPLFRTWATLNPDVIPDLVQKASEGTGGSLDAQIHVLIGKWAENNEQSLLVWLRQALSLRRGIRLAVARAFDSFGWASHQLFSEVYLVGITDSDPEIRNRFLSGCHSLLATHPEATAELLLGSEASSVAITRAIEVAAGYKGVEWGKNLAEAEADAVLRLIDKAGWRNHTVQEVWSGMAGAHPQLVLRHLLGLQATGASLPLDVWGMADAFDVRAAELVEWMMECAKLPDRKPAALVTSLAMGKGVSSKQAAALISAIESLDGPGLVAVLDLLRGVATWPLRQPDLARAIFERAKSSGVNATDEIIRGLRGAMEIRFWSFDNGVSPELNAAYDAAVRLAESESDPLLKGAYAEASDSISYDKERALKLHEDDED